MQAAFDPSNFTRTSSYWHNRTADTTISANEPEAVKFREKMAIDTGTAHPHTTRDVTH